MSALISPERDKNIHVAIANMLRICMMHHTRAMNTTPLSFKVLARTDRLYEI